MKHSLIVASSVCKKETIYINIYYIHFDVWKVISELPEQFVIDVICLCLCLAKLSYLYISPVIYFVMFFFTSKGTRCRLLCLKIVAHASYCFELKSNLRWSFKGCVSSCKFCVRSACSVWHCRSIEVCAVSFYCFVFNLMLVEQLTSPHCLWCLEVNRRHTFR